MKKLSPKDEKKRRSMSDLKIGELVWDMFNGCISVIRGFENPWSYYLEPCERNGYWDNLDEKYYTEHFTNLEPYTKEDIQKEIRRVQKEAAQTIKEWKAIAKMGGFKL